MLLDVFLLLLTLQVKAKGAHKVTWPELVKALDHIAAKKVRALSTHSALQRTAVAMSVLPHQPPPVWHTLNAGSIAARTVWSPHKLLQGYTLTRAALPCIPVAPELVPAGLRC
jgi:hypothetical protein